MPDNDIYYLIDALQDLREKNQQAIIIKIYYVDNENYTIKFIGKDGVKYNTIRKVSDRNKKAIDINWRKLDRKEDKKL